MNSSPGPGAGWSNLYVPSEPPESVAFAYIHLNLPSHLDSSRLPKYALSFSIKDLYYCTKPP